MESNPLWLAVVAFIIAYFFVRHRTQLPVPPGPPGLPIIGIAHKYPKHDIFKKWAEWGHNYGKAGILSYHVLGRRIVVLNSVQVAEDLLAKRGVIYSDRPPTTFSGKLMKREDSMFLISYNERFKMYRRLFRRFFGPGAEKQYWSVEEIEARITTARMLKDPAAFVLHLRRNAAAVIMKIGFGYSIAFEDDHFVQLAEENLRIVTTASRPGAWLVDAIPILRFIPSWFPGARFKRLAKEWRETTHKMALEPHNYVKQQIREGVAEPSFTSQLLCKEDGSFVDAETEDAVFWAAGALYTAGTDTTVAALEAFIYLMMTHPDIQSRAQDEVDYLVSQTSRLPTLEDRPALPFLDNVLKEVLRWSCVAPVGIPHSNSKEDIYYVGDRGYRIPKGSIVFANIWNMAFDAEVYPNPFTFDPNRFEGDHPQRDPRGIIFGFGKRICAGQNIAESTMFIQMATILATALIEMHQEDLGKELRPTFTSAAVRHLAPFRCRITARSNKNLPILDQNWLARLF